MSQQNAYKLLDSGHGRKLEMVGSVLVDRQSPAAFWKPSLPAAEWKKCDAYHVRSETGGGHWEPKKKLPESWVVSLGGLQMKTKLTSFGHLGYFPEQSSQWPWLREVAAAGMASGQEKRPAKILNLFGYTGGSSISMALAGAEVTHVDAAKGVVDWGKENAALNAVSDGKIRWMVDDCLAFVKREERRGKFYDGVVLDPPTYGRGPNKEVFKIEEHVQGLLEAISKILVPEPLMVHFSSHTPGFTPQVLENLIADYLLPQTSLKSMTLKSRMIVEHGEMLVAEQGSHRERLLPSGVYCRLSRQKTL